MYQADNVMVGYLFDMTAVGIYVVAYQFVQTPVNALFVDAGRAMTTALSRGRALDDSGRGLLERWLSIALPMAGVLALGMACAGPSLVRAIFGDGWSEAGPVTSALSVVFLGRSVSLSEVPYLISSGRFVWISSLKWLEASVFVVCFWLLGERYGLVGAALGGGIGYLVAAALRLGDRAE